MAKRRYNPRLAKIHRSYTVEEVAALYGVHKNSVRQWVKHGLAVCDNQRPMLILGSDLRNFLFQKRTKNKCPLKANEIYCLKCRKGKVPAEGIADYEPITATGGNMVGICPDCESMMYRRISLTQIDQIQGKLAITLPQALKHINESAEPSVNSGLE